MKRLILILLVLSVCEAKAQMFTFEKDRVILTSDTLTVSEGFRLIKKVIPWQYTTADRVVIIKGQKYYKNMTGIMPLFTINKAITIVDGKKKKVRI